MLSPFGRLGPHNFPSFIKGQLVGQDLFNEIGPPIPEQQEHADGANADPSLLTDPYGRVLVWVILEKFGQARQCGDWEPFM